MKSTDSFTVIELLVVVTIIGILTGITVPFFNNFTAERKLSQEASKIGDVLELARKKASAGETTCSDFTGYQVAITSNVAYNMALCCVSGCTTVQSYQIPTDNNVIIDSGVGTISFKPLAQGATASPSTIKFKSTINKCINVVVSESGTIDVGNPYTSRC